MKTETISPSTITKSITICSRNLNQWKPICSAKSFTSLKVLLIRVSLRKSRLKNHSTKKVRNSLTIKSPKTQTDSHFLLLPRKKKRKWWQNTLDCALLLLIHKMKSINLIFQKVLQKLTKSLKSKTSLKNRILQKNKSNLTVMKTNCQFNLLKSQKRKKNLNLLFCNNLNLLQPWIKDWYKQQLWLFNQIHQLSNKNQNQRKRILNLSQRKKRLSLKIPQNKSLHRLYLKQRMAQV